MRERRVEINACCARPGDGQARNDDRLAMCWMVNRCSHE